MVKLRAAYLHLFTANVQRKLACEKGIVYRVK
jgi:hypothetical protein